ALGQGGIKAFHGEDAVHAVHAEPLGGVAHAVGLGQDQGSGLIVHGQEDQVSAVVLGVGHLDGEVGVVAVGEGGVADDLQAAGSSLFQEGVVDALGVHVVVLPDDGDLGAQTLLSDVLGRGSALVGVH